MYMCFNRLCKRLIICSISSGFMVVRAATGNVSLKSQSQADSGSEAQIFTVSRTVHIVKHQRECPNDCYHVCHNTSGGIGHNGYQYGYQS